MPCFFNFVTNVKTYNMGRGDKKTNKGKIFKGSHGKARPAKARPAKKMEEKKG